jgi:hypothetical protein
MSVDFRELLSRPKVEYDKPPTLPEGHYLGRIIRHEFDRSSEKQTPFVRYFIQPTAATEDVEEAELEGVNITEYELQVEFYITPKALYRLREFHVSLGFDENSNFDDDFSNTRGLPVLVTVVHGYSRKDREKKNPFANISEIVGLAEREIEDTAA